MSKDSWPLCEVCENPVTTLEGCLLLYHDEMKGYDVAEENWRNAHPVNQDSMLAPISMTELLDRPLPVAWHWGHNSCLDEGMYFITADRLDTIEKVLSWTFHLMEKRWINTTKWEKAIRRIYDIPHA